MSTAYSTNSYSKAMLKKLFLLGMLFPATSFSTPSVEVLFNTKKTKKERMKDGRNEARSKEEEEDEEEEGE